MEKVRLFSAIAATVAVIACSKETVQEFVPETPAEEVEQSGYFTAECGDPTKVTMDAGDGYKLSWEAGDKVAVYKAGGSELSEYTAKTAGATTILEGAAIDAAANYYAIYPLSAAVAFDGTSSITAKVAASQALSKDTLPENVMVAYTTGAEASLSFRNVGSLVQFTLSGNNVSRVAISAVDGEDVAGVIDITSPSSPSYTVGEGYKTLVLTPAGGAATFEAGTYYAAILPRTYAKGISVKVFDNEGRQASRKQGVAQAITRSGRLNIGTIDTWSFEMNRTIRTAEDFANFLAVAASDGDNTWTIVDGIELKGVELHGAVSFAGTLDGGNMELFNLNLTEPLFANLTGTVQDLTIGSGSSLTFSHIAGSYGFIAGVNEGTIEGVTVNGTAKADYTAFASPVASTYVDMCIGGVAGTNSGTLVNCTSNVNFAIISDVSKYTPTYLGGIVGKQASTDDLTGCSNTGSVSLNNPDRDGLHISASCFVGGIVGGTKYGETVGAALKDCTNSGDIEVIARDGSSSLPEIKLGGIAGYLDGTLDNCGNSGSIRHTNPTETAAGDSFRNCTIAGVAGTVTGAITGCENTGDVTISGSFCYSTAGTLTQTFFGGVAGYAGGAVTNCTNENPLTVTAYMNSTSTSAKHNGYIGGIAGYVAGAINGSTNTGALDIRSKFYTAWVGGIGGYTLETIGASALCSNSGAIDYDFVNTAASGNQAVMAYIGGISGQHAGTDKTIRADQTASSGNISVKNGFYHASLYSWVGGIAGHTVGAINGTANTAAGRATYSGTITVNSNIQLRAGGIAAESAKTLLNVCYSGKINVPELGAKSCVGGFTGVRSGSNVGGSTLTGTITCAYPGEQNTTNNVRVGLCHGVVTVGMTTHSTTIGASAKLTAEGGIYAGAFAGAAGVALTMGNPTNAFTYRPGVTFNGASVSSVDDLTDAFLVGRLYNSGAITRTNLKVE